MGMDRSRKRVLVGVLVVTGFAAALASAGSAKNPKPTRVVASADYVQLNPCFPVPPIYGHIEVLAYDDDPSIPFSSSERQVDRVSITITRSDGTVWELDPLGVMLGQDGHSIYVPVSDWNTGFWLYDGGNPGSGPTGAFDQGVAVTNDSMRYVFITMCSSARFYLTSGNIKISTDA